MNSAAPRSGMRERGGRGVKGRGREEGRWGGKKKMERGRGNERRVGGRESKKSSYGMS